MIAEMIDGIVGFWLALLPLAMVAGLVLGGLLSGLMIMGALFAVSFQPYRKIPRSQKGAQKVEKHA